MKAAVKITGLTPLICHNDNLDWADLLAQHRGERKKKEESKAGDDRQPSWSWIGSLYHDGQQLAIPSDMLTAAIVAAAAKVRNGKSSFKQPVASGMAIQEPFCPILVNGKSIPYSAIYPELKRQERFSEHQKAVENLGFSLFVKRAVVTNRRHVRVRPRFENWATTLTVEMWNPKVTTAVLQEVFEVAGDEVGIGDWRPSCRRPGPFGRFMAEVEQSN